MSEQPWVQLGMNGRFFPANWRPARQEIAFARNAGFQAIQFATRDEPWTETRLDDSFAALQELLQAAGLTAVMEIVVFINAQGRTRHGLTPLDVLEANLPAISGLHCYAVHWHLAPAEMMTPAMVTQVERALLPQFHQAVALADDYDFRFGLEHNEPDLLLFGTPLACQMMVDDVPGLHFVWDLNHTTAADLTSFLALAPRMSMLHVSDTPLPAVNYHFPLGQGSVDFAHYFAELQRRGFSGPAILEIGGQPKSGGFGRDTDEALMDSQRRLMDILNRTQVNVG